MARFPVDLYAAFPPSWWSKLEDSVQFQTIANYSLAAAYGILALVALCQLLRIHLRVPEYGWTTQKVFHLLNLLVCTLRSGVWGFRSDLETLREPTIRLVLFDLPGLLFFTTYTLLVLFWAEIFHQARMLPTGSLRPMFILLNVAVYVIQAGLWAFEILSTGKLVNVSFILSDVFLAAVSTLTAIGFLVYGGRLFLMLQRFPIESRGRRNKIREVGLVTSICGACFFLRACMVGLTALNRQELELDVLGHPLLNLVYYTTVEILPSASCLYILRKLPPKRTSQGYQQIPAQ